MDFKYYFKTIAPLFITWVSEEANYYGEKLYKYNITAKRRKTWSNSYINPSGHRGIYNRVCSSRVSEDFDDDVLIFAVSEERLSHDYFYFKNIS